MNRFNARLVCLLCRLRPYRCSLQQPVQAQSAETSFFVTSNGIGNGANLGGLAGADNHCQTLAQAAGSGAPRPGTPISRPRRPTARLP